MDMEKGEGIELAKKFKIRAFPTLLFLDGDGNIVHKKLGAAGTAEGFNDIGRTALDDTKNTSSWDKKYKKGERSPEFITAYIKLKNALYENEKAKELFDWYFATTPKKDFLNKEGFNMIMKNGGLCTPSSDFVFENKAEYEKALGKKLSNVILQSQGRSLTRMAGRNPEKYKETANYLREKLGDEFNQIEEYIEWNSLTRKDPASAFTKAIAYVNNYGKEGDGSKVQLAMQMSYTKGLGENHFKTAMDWVEAALKAKKDDVQTMDIKVALLHRMGKTKKALKLQKKVFEKMPENQRERSLSAYVLKNFKVE